MKIVLARPRGVCAGVERAVKIVEIALERFGAPVYVRKEIVHNQHIVGRLRDEGAVFVEELDEVPDDAMVIFAAHGISPEVRDNAKQRGLKSIDATCPLVSKVHVEVLRYVKKGYELVFIGHEGHDEVIGTLGHAPDKITLVTDAAEARTVILPEDKPMMVLTQTTLSMDDTQEILSILKSRYPSLETPSSDDICYATQNRQNAVKELCDHVDLLLVVGSQNSSNASRLAEMGVPRGIPGYLIDTAAELKDEWLEGVTSVGVTSGASTPEELVQGVVEALKKRGANELEQLDTISENVVFTLPPSLREKKAVPAPA